jgi:hypothetical protein
MGAPTPSALVGAERGISSFYIIRKQSAQIAGAAPVDVRTVRTDYDRKEIKKFWRLIIWQE